MLSSKYGECRYAAAGMLHYIEFAIYMYNKTYIKRGVKRIPEVDIDGSYEEIYSNWKNKMYHAADKNDVYLSLMTAASCQQFYDEMYNEYNTDRIDLMKNITDNLTLPAKAFDDAMEEYKKNYDRLRMKIKYYKDLDEFERKYIE